VKVADGAMGNEDVSAIAAGRDFCVVLKNNKVYTWGNGESGHLGDGNEGDAYFQWSPVLVSYGQMINSNVAAISNM